MSQKFSVEWLSQSHHAPRDASPGAAATLPPSPAQRGFSSGARRRVRTKFSSEQIARLEKSFGKHRYLGASHRRRMAEKLRLSEAQVKTWFQNRRMKLKREVQHMRAAEIFVPVTSFQHQAMSGQRARLYYPARALHCSTVPAQPHMPPMLFAPCYF